MALQIGQTLKIASQHLVKLVFKPISVSNAGFVILLTPCSDTGTVMEIW